MNERAVVAPISRLYGVNVASPYDLADPPAPGSTLDITVRTRSTDSDLVADTGLSGRLIAELVRDRPRYRLVEHQDGTFTYRFHGLANITISASLDELDCEIADDPDDGMFPILLAGNVLAAILLLRGHCVLHASSVARHGRCIAFVANSGSGKSTLAAMSTFAGTQMVTDDVLRIDIDADGLPVAYRGGRALRLRPTSKALSDRMPVSLDTSVDGRALLHPRVIDTDRTPLSAIYFPRLSSPESRLVVTPVDPATALFAVMERPRVMNWSDVESAARHFETLATVVNTVPAYTVDIPWGLERDLTWYRDLVDLLFAAP